MKLKKIIAMTALTAIAASFTACGGNNGASADKIVIGGIGPLTGDLAMYGTAAMNGAQLSFDEGETLLELPVQFIALDDKGDNTEAVNNYNKLVDNNGAAAIIGAVTSQPSSAVAVSAAKANMPMITPTGTAADITIDRDNVFRACFTDPFQGQIMAQFAFENLNSKNAAVIYNNDSDYSNGLAESFKETFESFGGTITSYEAYAGSDKDFKSQLTNIAATNPEVLFIPDYYATVALIAKQVQDVGLNAVLLGADGWDSVHTVVEDQSLINGAFFCNHYSTDDPDPIVQNFVTKYKEKYNETPNAFAALGYDSAAIIKQAIEAAGSTDNQAVVDALKGIDYNGVTGHITFDENGDPVKSVTILQINNGSYELYDKIEPSAE